MNFNDFFNELKRRNVFKGTVSYLVFSWVLLQVVSILSPIINAPTWIGKLILIILIVLLPVWVFVSWYFEVTPDGIKKTKTVAAEKSVSKKTGKKMNTFIIVFLILAITLLFLDRFRITSQKSITDTELAFNKLGEKSIAVLPFRDMSPNKQQGYFADGLAEELLNSLAKIKELKVTSRTSAFSFKNKEMGIPEIAKKLNVNYILEGSVRTHDSLIRVSVKLIETNDDNNIWSQHWDKELKNIFQIQNEIAEAVAENLQLSILDNIIPKVKEAKTDAYELFLESRYTYQNSNDDAALMKAETLIKKSLAIDSTYAPALITLGDIYFKKNNFGLLSLEEAKKLTKDIAKRAIATDSTFADGYSFMSLVALLFDKDIALSETYIDKALAIEGNNIRALERASEIANLSGNIEEAIKFQRRIVALDPVNQNSYYGLAKILGFAGKYVEAEHAIIESLKLEPNQTIGYYTHALMLLNQKKYSEALLVLEKEPLEGFRLHLEGIIYHFTGEEKKSEAAIKKLIDNYQESWSFQIASTYGAINQPEKMYYWLDKAKEYDDQGLIELHVDPIFEPYRNQTRFKNFQKSLGYKY